MCSGDVPEVEIISLLGEQLPRYRLRADTVFGYDHDDWLRACPGPPEPMAPLTPRQIEETLQYFRECLVPWGRGAGEGSGGQAAGQAAVWAAVQAAPAGLGQGGEGSTGANRR